MTPETKIKLKNYEIRQNKSVVGHGLQQIDISDLFDMKISEIPDILCREDLALEQTTFSKVSKITNVSSKDIIEIKELLTEKIIICSYNVQFITKNRGIVFSK